jgi:hypothetical protein
VIGSPPDAGIARVVPDREARERWRVVLSQDSKKFCRRWTRMLCAASNTERKTPDLQVGLAEIEQQAEV